MALDPNLSDPTLRRAAVEAACGRRPFDLLIENARILDMVTGRQRKADIGIVGALIASVHAPDEKAEASRRIDAAGAMVVPGLIDTHMHVESSMITPATYSDRVLPKGVTTALWDPHELANVAGLAGVDYALEAARAATLRFLTLAPTCVPSAPGYELSGGDFDADVIADLMARDDIHGAAELMTMQPLLAGEDRVTGIVNAGLAAGKRVCGHGRGLVGRELSAYVAAGVETDHELTSADDLIARLEAGMTVELRGSHEHLLPEFAAAILALGLMPQTLTLCTDDVFADDLLNKGALDQLMRTLIREGLPPFWVYQAATLNGASRIGRPDLGLIAPGKRADIVILSDIEDVRASMVVMNGALVASEGQICTPSAVTERPAALSASVRTRDFVPDDFEIASNGSSARITTLSKPRFPEWGEREVTIENGHLQLPDDMIRMAVVNRHGQNTPVRVAFMENWGNWRGSFASTVSHDSHNLTLFGRDPLDMAVAANALKAMDGGLVAVRDGAVIASVALPVAGLLSDQDLDAVAADFAAVRAATDSLVDWQPPYLVFKALFGASLVCNKGPRLTDVGLVEVFDGIKLESSVLEGKAAR
nr:adenine deaminase C-terminal domain-containing protein [uncultured Cohaesibacter sp.]